MKHILIALVFFNIHLCRAQEAGRQLQAGIKAGFLLVNLSPDFKGNDQGVPEYFARVSVTTGARLWIPLGKNVVFLPELCITGKGADARMPYYTESDVPAFLELTGNVLANFPLKGSSFFIGGGPSVAFIMSEYTQFLSNRDAGINLLTGYKWPIGFSLEFNYNMGLIKQAPRGYDGVPVTGNNPKTSTFGLCVGYTF